MSTLNYASFLIPYFNLLFCFIGDGLALCLTLARLNLFYLGEDETTAATRSVPDLRY